MKIIFLDFDGVLNSVQSQAYWHSKTTFNDFLKQEGGLFESLAHEFCPIALSNLNELIKLVPDAEIVISSTWRKGNDIERIKGFLKAIPEVAKRVVNKTPEINGSSRGEQIQAYLENLATYSKEEIETYVILDDDRDMMEHQKKYHVRTSPLHGLQYGDILHAERILKGERG